jgi:hypothetical protein
MRKRITESQLRNTTRVLENEDIDEKPKVKGKKLIIVTIFIILIILISAQLLYWYVIPRLTIDFKTTYHEATGGGGTGGIINVNTKFINSGTVEVEDLTLKITLLNTTQTILIDKTYEQGIVSPGDQYELKVVTNGNTFETFYIIVEAKFSTGNNDYNKKYLYETHEDAMNIGFEDSVFEWDF